MKDFRPLINFYAAMLGLLGFTLAHLALNELELYRWLFYSLGYMLREDVTGPAVATFCLSLLYITVPTYFSTMGWQCFRRAIAPAEA